MASTKPSGGRPFSKTGLIRGRESEGRKAILVSKRHNTRVAPIGPDGLTTDGGEKVPTADVLDIQPTVEPESNPEGAVPGIMGERGTVTIPSEIRRRLRLQAGSPIRIAVLGEVILIEPAEIRPRASAPSPTLDSLLAGVTPENIHTEVAFGPPVGGELL